MNAEANIAALLELWDEARARRGWEQIVGPLQLLLEQFTHTTDEDDRAAIAMQISDTLRRWSPDFHRIFVQRRAALKRATSGFAARGVLERRIEAQLEALSQALPSTQEADHPPLTRYTDLVCPRRVWIQTRRVPVVVGLTRAPIANSAAPAPLSVQPGLVQVSIDAPGFAVLGPFERTLVVQPDRDSDPVVFYLAPQRLGETTITVMFHQDGHPLHPVSAPIEITATEVVWEEASIPAQAIRPPALAAPPDIILYVSYDAHPTARALRFELRTPDSIGRRFPPVPLTMSLTEYTAQLYRRLSQLTAQHELLTAPDMPAPPALTPDDVDSTVKEAGQALWRTLLPPELKQLYAAHRAQWRDGSLLIVTDEPSIPWELLWPYDDLANQWEEVEPLALLMRLTRWLRRNPAQGTAHPEPPSVLPLRGPLTRLAIICPSDSQLRAAQTEQAMLRAQMAQAGIIDTSPPAATLAQVRQLLHAGQYEWLHVVAHGTFGPADPDSTSAIWLQHEIELTTQVITGAAEGQIRRQRPAFVFNACKAGRLGWALTGIGGWAERLLSVGASLFLAPLWVVNDQPAAALSHAFYDGLLGAGLTVGEALRQARRAAYVAGDPTWLAYSLYAHPNARVQLAPATERADP